MSNYNDNNKAAYASYAEIAKLGKQIKQARIARSYSIGEIIRLYVEEYAEYIDHGIWKDIEVGSLESFINLSRNELVVKLQDILVWLESLECNNKRIDEI